MSDIREKIMAIEAPDQFDHSERFGFNFAIGYAAAAAEDYVQRLEEELESWKDSYHTLLRGCA